MPTTAQQKFDAKIASLTTAALLDTLADPSIENPTDRHHRMVRVSVCDELDRRLTLEQGDRLGALIDAQDWPRFTTSVVVLYRQAISGD